MEVYLLLFFFPDVCTYQIRVHTPTEQKWLLKYARHQELKIPRILSA